MWVTGRQEQKDAMGWPQGFRALFGSLKGMLKLLIDTNACSAFLDGADVKLRDRWLGTPSNGDSVMNGPAACSRSRL